LAKRRLRKFKGRSFLSGTIDSVTAVTAYNTKYCIIIKLLNYSIYLNKIYGQCDYLALFYMIYGIAQVLFYLLFESLAVPNLRPLN